MEKKKRKKGSSKSKGKGKLKGKKSAPLSINDAGQPICAYYDSNVEVAYDNVIHGTISSMDGALKVKIITPLGSSEDNQTIGVVHNNYFCPYSSVSTGLQNIASGN